MKRPDFSLGCITHFMIFFYTNMFPSVEADFPDQWSS